MKTPRTCIAIFVIFVASLRPLAQWTNSKVEGSRFGPEPKVFLISGANAWSIADLNRKAVALLARHGKVLLNNGHTSATVHVYLGQKGIPYDIRYAQGFGQHAYTVQFGDNGEILRWVDEGIEHEAIAPEGSEQQKFYQKYLRGLDSAGTNAPR
jgi:hypothetical protein